MLLSVFRKSANISSESSGARICKKLTAPYLPPMPKVFALPKHREDGAIKSLVERPEGVIHFQSKLNSSPSGWNTPWSTASRSLPFITWATAPIVLK